MYVWGVHVGMCVGGVRICIEGGVCGVYECRAVWGAYVVCVGLCEHVCMRVGWYTCGMCVCEHKQMGVTVQLGLLLARET